MLRGHGGDVLDAGERTGLPAEEILDFSANMNPLGPHPHLRDVIYSSVDDIVSYPDVECRKTRRRLADEFEIEPGRIIIGNGSTELIYLLMRALSPRRVAVFPPCYLDYQRASEIAGADAAGHVRTPETSFILDPESVRSACESAEVIWIGNPNNPTGDVIDRGAIRGIALEHPGKIFIIDEAFIEFAIEYESLTMLSNDTPPNVVIMRSLTKFFAIPGLRLGFAVAVPDIVRLMERLKEPWAVNSIALAVGERLYDDRNYIERSRRFVAQERDFLMRGLSEIEGLRPFGSSACFIMCRIEKPGLNSPKMKSLMLQRGILIRDCANFKGLDGSYIRAAVKTRQQNEQLLAALADSLMEGAAG